MIVKCEKCQTKFKVGDEHISDQGTLVRCSKCQNTFQVRRPAGAGVGDDPLDIELDAVSAPDGAGAPSLADELFGDLPGGNFAGESTTEGQTASPAPEVPDHSQFEMPPPPPEEEVHVGPRELLPPEEALLPPAPPKSRLLGPHGFHPPTRQPVPARSGSRVRAALAGLLVNLAVATGLLLVLGAVGTIYANDGKLDPSAFSAQRIGALIKANREALAVESWNGLYDTKAGKPVFYIRGEAQNTTGAATKLKVRAEILDGAQLVRSAEVLAGSAAGPEDLYNISSSVEADALAARLEAAATVVAPGERAPFMLTFYDYPPNLSAFRLKVTVGAFIAKDAAR